MEKNVFSILQRSFDLNHRNLYTLIPEIVEELKDQNIYTCALPALTAGGHPRVQQHETNGYHLGGLIVRTLGLLGENE